MLMNILIVSAFMSPKSLTASLHNAALGTLERDGHSVAVTSLYSQQFNPVASSMDFTTSSGVAANYMFEQQRTANTHSDFSPDIQAEMKKISDADIILFHFPLWWGGVPAIMKGWFERVFAMGFAWDAGHRYENGLLRGKRALVCLSSGDPDAYYSAEGMHRASIVQHLYPLLHGTLAFCGLDVLQPIIISNVTASDTDQTQEQIKEYQTILGSIEQFNKYLYKHAN